MYHRLERHIKNSGGCSDSCGSGITPQYSSNIRWHLNSEASRKRLKMALSSGMSMAASMESLSALKSAEEARKVVLKDPKPVDNRYRKRGSIPYSCRAALSALSFLIMTLIYIMDIASDIWVIAVFAMDKRMARLGFSIVIFAFTSLTIGFLYVFNIKKLQPQMLSMAMALCMCINFPFHLGILYERLEHQVYKFSICCRRLADQQIITKDWIFAKLKLAHATFQSAPFVIMNVVTILQDYPNEIHIANQVGATLSLFSLVFSAALHEINRKHYQQDKVIGMSRVICIFCFSFVLILARMMAMANFAYYYRSYLAVIIVGHVVIVFLYFVVVYRNVWNINLGRIALHTLYCTVSYFPIHNDYRPDGEIMAYYVIYMIENIIMVALPFKIDATAPVKHSLKPGTPYYHGLTGIVLFGSALGLILLSLYYFCLHRERKTIRQDHFACFGICCRNCCKKKNAETTRRPIYIDPSAASTTESRLTNVANNDQPTVDQPFLNETGPPPAYNDLSDYTDKRSTPPLNDSDETEEIKIPLTPPSAPAVDGERTAADIGERTAADIGERTAADIGERTAADIGERTAADIGERTAADIGERTASDIGERTAADIGERTVADIGEAYAGDKATTASMAAKLEQLRAKSQQKPKEKKSFNPFKKSKS